MRRLLPILVLLLNAAPAVAGDQLLLTGARLVDPGSKTVRQAALLIRDGKIARIEESIPPESVPGAQVLELKGRWVIPGLHDLHVHSWGNPFPDGTDQELGPRGTASAMLFAGVTAYLDLYTPDLRAIFGERERQRKSGPGDAAELFAAGAGFLRHRLDGQADPEVLVQSYASEWKPDVIKVIHDHAEGKDTLDRKSLSAVIRAAEKLGLKTIVHIGTWKDAREAVEAGASALTHFDDEKVVPDAVVALMKKRGTAMIPTMAVQCDLVRLIDRPEPLEEPLFQALLPPAARSSFLNVGKFTDKTRRALKWQRRDMKNDLRTFRKLYAAGIPILAGSDTGNLGVIQGGSLHRELELYVEGGASAWSALESATLRAARFLRRESGLLAGAPADLVILSGDPIADIRNTRRIEGVIRGGKPVDRKALLRYLFKM